MTALHLFCGAVTYSATPFGGCQELENGVSRAYLTIGGLFL